MVLVVELTMLVAGIIFLFRGEIPLTKTTFVDGMAAYVAAFFLVLPTPLAICIAIIFRSTIKEEGGQIKPGQADALLLYGDLPLMLICGFIGAGVAMASIWADHRRRYISSSVEKVGTWKQASELSPLAEGKKRRRSKGKKGHSRSSKSIFESEVGVVSIGAGTSFLVALATWGGIVWLAHKDVGHFNAPTENSVSAAAESSSTPSRSRPNPSAPRWTAKADPLTEAPASVAAKWQQVFLGQAVFAAKGGPFVADVPQQLALPVRLYDLCTGDCVGRSPQTALQLPRTRPYDDVKLLSPDGQTMLALGKQNTLAVWKLDADQPTGSLPLSGTLTLVDFLNDPNQVVTVCAGQPPVVQVWDLTKCALVRSINVLSKTLDAARGAVSPGGKYLALSGPRQVMVFDLADGTLTGAVALNPFFSGAAARCHGLQFSPDGEELLGVFAPGGGGARNGPQLLAWTLSGGSLAADVKLTGLNIDHVPVIGPEKGLVFLGDQLINKQSGQLVSKYSFAPSRWLADGRLIGPVAWSPPQPEVKTSKVGDVEIDKKIPESLRAGLLGDEEQRALRGWWQQFQSRKDTWAMGVVAFDRDALPNRAEPARPNRAPRR